MAHLTVPVTKKDHIQGSLDAPFILVEYGDYQCPFCGRAYPVVKQVQEAMGNKLCFVFRNFPLKEAHPFALMAAQAAEAAALQKKFWEMHDLIYENQKLLSPDLLAELADQLKLDLVKFKSDFRSTAVMKKIEDDFINGVRSGVNGTPSFFINSVRYDGEPTFEEIMEALS
jgi:protein-disulfide isomerase